MHSIRNVGAWQAGINKAYRRKHPSSETKGSNQGKPPRFRVACWQCPPNSNGTWEPQHVFISGSTKSATCKNGHHIDCSGGCVVVS